MGSAEAGDLEKEVFGEYYRFRVYLHMLKVGEGSVKSVQEALGLSVPTLAMYHLEKLVDLGLVRKNGDGNYHVVPKSFGILKLFVIVGTWIVPRTLFIGIVFAVMSVVFLTYLPDNEQLIWALIPSVIGLVASIYQTVRSYRLLKKSA